MMWMMVVSVSLMVRYDLTESKRHRFLWPQTDKLKIHCAILGVSLRPYVCTYVGHQQRHTDTQTAKQYVHRARATCIDEVTANLKAICLWILLQCAFGIMVAVYENR